MVDLQHNIPRHELERLVPPMTHEHSTDEGPENVHADSAAKNTDVTNVAPLSKESNRTWTPFYLKTTTLIGFVIVYLVLLLGIIVLAVADLKNHGITTAKTSEHYLWTYGPTAVLAILAALWGQVEYRTKQAMPWRVLQKGPTPASKTLLLDYITPSLPEALISSLHSAHWPVAIAITNSLLIRLLTVASTGLLVLLKTGIAVQECQLTTADDFVTSFNTSAIGSAAVLSTLSIQNGSILYPPGTSRNAAFQQLEAPNNFHSLADVEVEGFARSLHAGLDCETATVKSYESGCSDWQCHGLNLTISIDSPTCHINNFNYTKGCGYSQEERIECDIGDAWGIQCDTTADGHDKNRLIFLIGRMSEQRINNSNISLSILNDETATILCEANYNISSTSIRMDQNGNSENVTLDAVPQNASQPFPAWDLVDGLYTSTKAAGVILGITYGYTAWSSKPWLEFWNFFQDWAAVAYPLSDLTDAETLKTAANDHFSMAIAQMARQNLMAPSTDDLVGTCYATKWRLRVRGLSLYLMGATLIVSALSTLLLVYVAPRGYTSRDPATIGGLALNLSRSPGLLDQLSHQGSSDLRTVEKQLRGFQCQSVVSTNGERSEFVVELTTDKEKEAPDAEPVSEATTTPSQTTFWRPLSLHPIFKIFVAAFLLALIVVLEVLLSLSRKNDGLVQVDPVGYDRFGWVYVPAMTMLTAQVLVGMVAFSSLLIFPYSILRSRASNTRNDILRDYISQTAIVSAWKSAANKHFAALSITFAMLLSPLLTIAVSGLYTASPVETRTDVTLSVINQLNSSSLEVDLGSDDSAKISQAATSIGLLLTQNFTYPLQTFNDLVFPAVQLNLPSNMPNTTALISGSNLTTTLPAIRAELSCNSGQTSPKNFSRTFLYPTPELPGPFVQAGCSSSVGTSPGSNPFGFFSAGSPTSIFGTAFCGAYGTSEMDWRAFICVTAIQHLSVAVTLDASTHAILAATPDEDSATVFANRTRTTGISYFPSAVIPSIFGQADFGGATLAYSYFDPAFQALIYDAGTTENPYSFPIGDYMSEEGFGRIETHLRKVYRTVVAQAANLVLRVPYNASADFAPPATVGAVLTNPHAYRLQQSAVSTRILDGLLAAIAVCVVIAAWAMETRDVVPTCPAPIAVGAGLMAGGAEMLKSESLPEGAQWCGDRELEEKGVWSGCVFSLGWWGVKGVGGRFGLDMGKAER